MTAVDSATLRALAEAATPGPWAWEPKSDEAWPDGDESLVVVGEPGKPGATVLYGWGYDASGIDAEPQDRAFIAAANPTAILGLLDEVDRLRATVARVEALADEWARFGGDNPGAISIVRTIRAALEGQ